MTNEGRVYVCTWVRTPVGFRIWVRDQPEISAEGGSFQQAADELGVAIGDATGDSEGVCEFVPPEPSSAPVEDGVRTALASIGLQKWSPIKNAEELYTETPCPTCHWVRGRRTDVPAIVDKIASGFDGVRGYLYRMPLRPPGLRLLSERFLDLLTNAELENLSFLEVERTGKAGLKFFELVGSANAVPRVALRPELASVDLWRCTTCGWENEPWYNRPPQAPVWYLADRDVPSAATCFLIGKAPEHDLCFTRDRWESIVGRRGAEGMVSYETLVVDSSRVERDPIRRVRAPSGPTMPRLPG